MKRCQNELLDLYRNGLSVGPAPRCESRAIYEANDFNLCPIHTRAMKHFDPGAIVIRLLVLLSFALMAACADPGPHDVVSCSWATWNDGSQPPRPWTTSCELACEVDPATEPTGPSCTLPDVGICHPITWEGLTGCCVRGAVDAPVRFEECP